MKKIILTVATVLIATSTASAQTKSQQVCDTFAKSAQIAYSKKEEGWSFEEIKALLPHSTSTQRKVFAEAARIGYRADSMRQAEKEGDAACRRILSQ